MHRVEDRTILASSKRLFQAVQQPLAGRASADIWLVIDKMFNSNVFSQWRCTASTAQNTCLKCV